jgi:hypothetical protein
VLRRFMSSRAGKLGVAGAIVLALSAPALAEHFDFDSLVEGQQVTAADLHLEGNCPEPEEGQTEEEAQAECDGAVQEAFVELESYEHPENHGKYVSYLTHCLQGMKGKGEFVSQMAQESGDGQAELAVELCAEWKILQLSADEEDLASLSGKFNGKSKKAKSSEETEVETEVETEGDTEGSTEKGPKGNGKGKGKGRQGPK